VLDVDIFRCTSIPWSKIDLAYVLALCDLPTKGMLSAPRTNDKNIVRRHNDAKKQSANKLLIMILLLFSFPLLSNMSVYFA
jgi:hypothetical protein